MSSGYSSQHAIDNSTLSALGGMDPKDCQSIYFCIYINNDSSNTELFLLLG